MIPQDVSGAPIALYRLYDSAGSLLYAGITHSPAQRFAQHEAEKPWWPEVARRTVCWHDSKEAAQAAETDAITGERPRYNMTHGTDSSQRSTPPPQRVRGIRVFLTKTEQAAWKESGLPLPVLVLKGIAAASSPRRPAAAVEAPPIGRPFTDEEKARLRKLLGWRKAGSRRCPQRSYF